MRIALTTTSYQDTPGRHHEVLDASGFEVVRARGPLPEDDMLRLIADHGGFDGLLNGDDEITAKVIDAAMAAPTPLRVIAKYGIGLDSIDVKYATSKKIPVLFTPGVNHTTVAEHAMGLMIAASKHFYFHMHGTAQGQWKAIRKTGNELAGKTLGVLGMGRIGKELIKRATAFDMTPIAFDVYWDEAFARQYDVKRCATMDEVLAEADVVSLHMPATDETKAFINAERLALCKDGVMIVNTARGTLLDEEDVAAACKSGKISYYAADVLAVEPMTRPHPFDGIENIILTPHVGSRTYESVERQALRATNNVVNFLQGHDDYIQANPF
jgi:D-3-phosphoglycerate dehydrogenase